MSSCRYLWDQLFSVEFLSKRGFKEDSSGSCMTYRRSTSPQLEELWSELPAWGCYSCPPPPPPWEFELQPGNRAPIERLTSKPPSLSLSVILTTHNSPMVKSFYLAEGQSIVACVPGSQSRGRMSALCCSSVACVVSVPHSRTITALSTLSCLQSIVAKAMGACIKALIYIFKVLSKFISSTWTLNMAQDEFPPELYFLRVKYLNISCSFGGQAPPRLLNDCYGNALVSSCWLLNDCCSSPVVGSRCLAAGQIVSPVTFALPGLAAHRIHDYKLPKSMATKSFGGQFDLCSSCISSGLPPLMEEEMSGTNFRKTSLVVKYKPQAPGPPG